MLSRDEKENTTKQNIKISCGFNIMRLANQYKFILQKTERVQTPPTPLYWSVIARPSTTQHIQCVFFLLSCVKWKKELYISNESMWIELNGPNGTNRRVTRRRRRKNTQQSTNKQTNSHTAERRAKKKWNETINLWNFQQ